MQEVDLTNSGSTLKRKNQLEPPALEKRRKGDGGKVLAAELTSNKVDIQLINPQLPVTTLVPTVCSPPCDARILEPAVHDLQLASPKVYLRLIMGERQLQRLQQQMIEDELHACEENCSLRQKLSQQQIQEVQDEWALLRTLYYTRQKK